jgi:glycosyltransferase involved in cell wall biosynthesis
MRMGHKLTVTVGVPCYNEEKNIRNLLERIEDNVYRNMEVKDVIVVSSGCTDKTVEIVNAFIEGKPKYLQMVEDKRYGKAAAINHIIEMAQGEVVFIMGGDVKPDSKAFDLVARRFEDDKIGAVGTRNVPVTHTGEFMDFVGNQLWYVHHQVCTRYPKLGGDFIAFRKSIGKVDTLSAVDDLAVEIATLKKGYRVVYEAEACNFINTPKSASEYVKQRRRIFAGYLAIGNQPKTMSMGTGLTVIKHVF